MTTYAKSISKCRRHSLFTYASKDAATLEIDHQPFDETISSLTEMKYRTKSAQREPRSHCEFLGRSHCDFFEPTPPRLFIFIDKSNQIKINKKGFLEPFPSFPLILPSSRN
jgi:hypothetical protein